jgi:hypothetical protein
MTTRYRSITASDGTVIQGGLLSPLPEDYRDLKLDKLMLGVILEVYPSDQVKNRSAQQTSDRRGHTHECTVLIVRDGSSAYLLLENVIVTPDAPSGIDDYSERLPRGSGIQVDGGSIDSSLHAIDPYELDGDWCVVGFIGSRIDAPFIIRWWPHARNVFDPATSGEGYNQSSLVQNRRYFKRVNGVETVVTSKGDIVISTTFANSKLKYGSQPERGRFSRSLDDKAGGSIRMYVKPSQFAEVTFKPQKDGIGVAGAPEPELPQRNSPEVEPTSSSSDTETYIYVDKNQINFNLPTTFNVKANTDINLTAANNTVVDTDNDFTVSAGNNTLIDVENNFVVNAVNTAEIEAELIKLGEGAGADPVVLGQKLKNWLQNTCTVDSPFGPLKLSAAPFAAFGTTLSTKSVVE